jgi:hypothetical protein
VVQPSIPRLQVRAEWVAARKDVAVLRSVSLLLRLS